jgi:hypothetical protein
MRDDKLKRTFNELEDLASKMGLVVTRVELGIASAGWIEIGCNGKCRTFHGIKDAYTYIQGFSDGYLSSGENNEMS